MPNKIKLTKDEKVRCIDFLFRYEAEIKNNYGYYNWESTEIDKFCAKANIVKKTCRNKNHHYYFWFDTKTKTSSVGNVNDKAFHFLRHIRNAIAHGNIQKEDALMKVKDYNINDKQTMQGQLPINLFWSFVELVEHSKLILKNT